MDVKSLIAQNRALLSQGVSTARSPNSDRPVGYPPMAWSLPRGFYYNDDFFDSQGKPTVETHYFMPIKLPIGEGKIILHSHHSGVKCDRDSMCHQLGFQPTENMKGAFNAKFLFLYRSY